MNKHLHRLVFNARRGMRVAVAEHASASGKAGRGDTPGGSARSTCGPAGPAAPMPALLAAAAALALAGAPVLAQQRAPVTFASQLGAPRASLPQPYGSTGSPAVMRPFVYDPAKGSASGDLATSGQVSWTVNGTSATFNQGSQSRVVINWDSFDIAAGHSVQFIQDPDPSKYVSALNRIWSADPSLILGSLTANREVVLLNANGVYFGAGARVDTGKFIATSLNIADSVFEQGLRNVTNGSAVFSTAAGEYTATNLDGAVSVEAGAVIRSAAGGDVLLIAPRVVNQGRIETPQGQAVLAAGDKVYLMSSSDPAQRGLIVAVDPIRDSATNQIDTSLGTVENAATGSFQTPDAGTGALVSQLNEIRAESGSINLVGLAVKQNGVLNATTAVKGANGAIYLQAMAGTTTVAAGTATATLRGLTLESGSSARVGAALGTVEIGAGSTTAVLPSSASTTMLDAEQFNRSVIRVEGQAISVGSGAQILAPAGQVSLRAAADATQSTLFGATPATRNDGSRIVIASDATISVAGLSEVEVDGARNQGAQRLFRVELADVPVQRDGPLYRSQVFFDLRDAGEIDAADVSGSAAAVARTAAERSTSGGTLAIQAEGAVAVADGATLDVSGGSVRYTEATIKNTVVTQGGRPVTFAEALGDQPIDAVTGTTTSTLVPAYSEGQAGGALTLSGRQMQVAGTLRGQVTEGLYQRDGRADRASAAALTVGRTTLELAAIDLQPDSATAVDSALLADPLGATLDGMPTTLALDLSAVQSGGFGQLGLAATVVQQSAFGTLNLGAGGALAITAEQVSLDGEFRVPGGTIKITAVNASANSATTGVGDITVSGRSVLSTAGLWTNDSLAAAGTGLAAVAVDGGKITLDASHSMSLAPGAVVDASAGAYLQADGSLTRGSASEITLKVGQSLLFDTTLAIDGARLRAFDFDTGGTLTLNTPALTVGDAAAGGFTLAPEFFSSGGFGTINVNAWGDVRLASGTTLAPQLLNWELAGTYRQAASGDLGAAVASAKPLDERLVDRAPVNLSLAATRTLNPSLGSAGGSVIVERGAGIVLEPGAKLSLSATRNVVVGDSGGSEGQTSTLSAEGGTLTLAITGQRGTASSTDTGADPAGFLADQAIWLGEGARLTVAGTAELRPDTGPVQMTFATGSTAPRERQTGTVLGGGTIALTAARGYVVAEAGSQMNLDGAAASVMVDGAALPTTVARSAGTLTVSTPEGFVLDGSVSAQAPRDSAGRKIADGGQLTLAVGTGQLLGFTGGTAYPETNGDHPRQIVVDAVERTLGSEVAQGSSLFDALGNGTGVLRVALLEDSGIDGLSLAAGSRIRFDSALDWTASRSIVLDTPALSAAPGVQVALAAESLRLGQSAPITNGAAADRSAAADTSADGSTSLRLSAPSLDITSTVGLQGFSSVALDASARRNGEIRLTGVRESNDLYAGGLNFAGTLSLTAGQVYATSLSQFTIDGLDATSDADPGSRVIVRAPAAGSTSAVPLSAFGSLTIEATGIDQGGVLRQPFGSIRLVAERDLTLGNGSLTSADAVAADGTTAASLLYGTTANLSQWSLPGADFETSLPVAKGVHLEAATLVTSPGATVSAQGGGDVLAWEFFPGVGGSTDVLAADDVYAVLPDYAQGASLSVNAGVNTAAGLAGQQIVISTYGSGLAPGRYTLLPARLALLGGTLPQGAFLVRRDGSSGVLAAPVHNADGGVVVNATVVEAGAVAAATTAERFVIEPEATFLAKSDLRVTSVSSLLAQTAQAQGRAVPVLPVDAGQVSVAVTGDDTSRWTAALALDGNGARAGLLDFSASALAVVADTETQTPDGALGVSVAALSASGAGSVLLGGTRTAVTDADGSITGWKLDASGTDTVTVDLGSLTLRAEEVLIAASEQVTLAAGTQIEATASGTLGERPFTVSGDGALLAVSANTLEVTRTGVTTTQGRLVVGAGSRLAGAQVLLDGTAGLSLASDTTLAAGRLDLAAPTLVLGERLDTTTPATELTGGLLAAAREATDLRLRGYTAVSFAGTQDWAARDASGTATRVADALVIDTPELRTETGAVRTRDAEGNVLTTTEVPAATDLAAAEITVRNTTGRTAAGSTAGSGSLVLQALPPLQYGQTGGLTLGPGQTTLASETAMLRSGGDVVLQGSGGVTAQGDLTLSAARVTATSAAEQALSATGTLTIAQEAGSRTLGELVGAGASLTLSAARIEQAGTLDLAGGQLVMTASGSATDVAADVPTLRFAAGSTTRVGGFSVGEGTNFVADGDAGTLSATATQGRIEVAGTLDIGASRRADGSLGTGDAGSLSLMATGSSGSVVIADTAQLRGEAGSAATDRGGRLTVDVTTLASADALAQAAEAGGVDREFTLRVRQGDLALTRALTAERVVMSADAGTLSVNAGIDARAATGGLVQLAAGQDLVLEAGAAIDARATGEISNGGDVLLASSNGRLRLDAAATVDARGDSEADGRIVLRALRGADNRSVAIDALNVDQLQAGEVDIEAVKVYRTVTVGANANIAISRIATGANTVTGTGASRVGTLGQTAVRTDNNAFMANAATALTSLGVASEDLDRVHLRVGVEVQAAGDLTVASDWALNAERPGTGAYADAGFLTLRAAGNLNLTGSLSDGFASAATTAALTTNPRSWSMRLVSGADHTAAHLLATRDLSASATDTGNLVFSANKLVRTGAGSIEMAAGRDLRFAAGSSVYVAGRQAEGSAAVLSSLFSGQSAKPLFTEQGGRLELAAQRDITSPEATQLINNWLWRSGRVATTGTQAGLYATSSQFAWWNQFSAFAQSAGSFGGSDLRVSAGRDLVNVQAMVTTQAWADSRDPATAELQVLNGGNLDVTAGRDVVAGQYLVSRGEGRIEAGRDVAERTANIRADGTMLALMDGQWRVSAREDVMVAGAFNPTAVSVPTARANISPYFYSWGDDASLRLVANGGNAELDLAPFGLLAGYGLNAGATAGNLFGVLPASLSVVAASGNVDLLSGDTAVLFPAANGQLSLWAGNNVALGSTSTLVMGDSDPSLWPGLRNPSLAGDEIAGAGNLVASAADGSAALVGLRAGDSQPVQIHAEGNVETPETSILRLAKAAEISAGLDVIGLRVTAQNLADDDITTITAGRNLLAGEQGLIELAGPGELQVSAGASIDLGESAGVQTIGNLRNASLPATGASVSMRAAAEGTLDVAVLLARYLDAGGSTRSALYQQLLIDTVAAALKLDGLDFATAWAHFQRFPAAVQAAFGRQVLAAEFSAVYLMATPPTAAQLTDSLRQDFERQKAQLLTAGEAALANGTVLVLPGRVELSGSTLQQYLAELRALAFTSLDIAAAVNARAASLAQVASGWKSAVATGLGRSVSELEALVAANPQDPLAQAYQQGLAATTGTIFDRYRQQVLASETASAGLAASTFGQKSLPVRMAFYNQGFQVAELAGAGGTPNQPVWAASTPLMAYDGRLDMTQSAVVTQRGGDISLVNPGGAINVGLKDTAGSSTAIKGVIALGGGDIYGLARDDFQVNTQRVFIVGTGDMAIWSSTGDIDSGRGANTAVAAPALAARRSVDGVVFEVPATTTGSGLGILPDSAGVAKGTIGLYPAFGEILALDAFIRAPSVVIGSTIQGADNISAGSTSGSGVAVAPPPAAVTAPPASAESQTATAAATEQAGQARQRNSLLTVELVGLGSADGECSDEDRARGRCK